VARDVVNLGEFQATSIAQIAERAGISRQGFYFYFQSKDELLAQLVSEVLYGSNTWAETRSDWVDPARSMRGHVADTVELWRQNPQIMLAAVELGPRLPAIRRQWEDIVHEYSALLVDLLVSATTIEALRNRQAARRMMVTIVWMIERNCYMHFVHDSDESDAQLTERLGDVYLRAFGVEEH
jgi:TetR/AcrR family transcriptional regulator, ethionamide resistance regulator